MVVGLNGEVYKVAIGKGHNNDKKYLILLAWKCIQSWISSHF